MIPWYITIKMWGVFLKNRYGIKKNRLLHNGHRYNKDQNFEWRYLDMDIEHQSIICHCSVNFQTKNPPIFTRFGGSNPIISCSTHRSVFHTVVTWGRGLRHIHNGLTQGITLGFLVTEIIKQTIKPLVLDLTTLYINNQIRKPLRNFSFLFEITPKAISYCSQK